MIKVGLTGGIGTGKSYISNIFTHLYIPIYNSDTRAKKLMLENIKIKNELIKLLGAKTYINGQLNKKWIASQIFTNPSLKKQIEQIIHPEVKKDFEQWLNTHHTHKIIVKETALLIESGTYKDMDKVILVTAPSGIRIKRIMQRDNITQEEAIKRIKAQLPDNEKLKFADFVIENDEKKLLLPQVIKILQNICPDVL